ncbi:MAG: cytochrome c [Proteobacteria bacterium]|nr:cytochrome c [Pseudomonadota bacterium]
MDPVMLKGLKKSRSPYVYVLTLAALVLPMTAQAMPWSWDMYKQPTHKAQTEEALPLPEGTVPTKGKLSMKDRDAAATLKNTVQPTSESIARGREVYNIYCSLCHGKTGVGDGIVGEKFITPADLTDEYIQTKPDGDIYYTITNGGLAVMPMQGDAIEPVDRWNVVNYIKHVLSQKK